jgi:hypothetical protein
MTVQTNSVPLYISAPACGGSAERAFASEAKGEFRARPLRLPRAARFGSHLPRERGRKERQAT